MRFSETKIENQEIVSLIVSEQTTFSDSSENTFQRIIEQDCAGKSWVSIPCTADIGRDYTDIVEDYYKQKNPEYPQEYIYRNL